MATGRKQTQPIDVTPSARRLTESLRDIGYDFSAALADLVDNSVAAEATEVNIEINFDGARSHVIIADNGTGMGEPELVEALRFGTRRDYDLGQLGRYGLGLKTASISQCRRASVATRRSSQRRRISSKALDLDHIDRTDRWQIIDPPYDSCIYRSLDWLNDSPGTVVVWEQLDRVLPEHRPEGGWAKRRLATLAEKSRAYLGMVFHRFLDGSADRTLPLTITVNGEKVRSWDPFAPLEERRVGLKPLRFEISIGGLHGHVRLNRYVLPSRDNFSSQEEFERLSGPAKWNRQQGLYIYRAGRLIQHGGWCGIRAADEHTKFARGSLDFQTDLDDLFQINVAKMRVALPPEVRTLIEKPVHDLCHKADAIYRRESLGSHKSPTDRPRHGQHQLIDVGSALLAAALDAGESEAILRVIDRLRRLDPALVDDLGW